MPTLTRDGIKLSYEQCGSSGPAIVFVHGWTCDRSFFAPNGMIEKFLRHYVQADAEFRRIAV